MTDTFDPTINAFKSFIFGGNEKSLPASTRQKIALAMMMQKRKLPTTFGEGLGAIGESLGDIGTMRRLEREAAGSEEAGKATEAAILGDGAAVPTAPAIARRSSYAPSDEPIVAQPIPPIADQAVPPLPPAAPAVPAPPDVPGAIRMSTPEQMQDFRAQNPMRAPPVPRGIAPAPAPMPQAPPQPPPLPQDQPAQGFDDRFGAAFPGRQSAVPGDAPVMAGDTPLPMADPRGGVARALMMQQTAPGVPQPNPTRAAGGGPPADPVTAIAQATTAPAQGIRPAPPAEPIQKAPEPGYVLNLPPEPTPPPTQTPLMQRIQKAIRDAPPADREALTERMKGYYDTEVAKLGQLQTIYKDQMTQRHELKKLQEEQRQKAPSDVANVSETRQKLVNYGQTRTPAGGAVAGPDPRLGTDQSPQRTGIPEPDPMPRGVIPAKWAEDQQKKMVADAANLDAARPELAETLDLVKKIREHPAKDWSIGTFGGLAKMTAAGQDFAALHEQLKGKNLVAAYQKVKGTGPVGEREGENIAKAQTALTTAGTKEGYESALATLETTIRGAVERAERRMKQPVTAYQQSPNDPYAPDIGQIDDTWKDGKVRQYIGGDPHNKEKSWKIIR